MIDRYLRDVQGARHRLAPVGGARPTALQRSGADGDDGSQPWPPRPPLTSNRSQRPGSRAISINHLHFTSGISGFAQQPPPERRWPRLGGPPLALQRQPPRVARRQHALAVGVAAAVAV